MALKFAAELERFPVKLINQVPSRHWRCWRLWTMPWPRLKPAWYWRRI